MILLTKICTAQSSTYLRESAHPLRFLFLLGDLDWKSFTGIDYTGALVSNRHEPRKSIGLFCYETFS